MNKKEELKTKILEEYEKGNIVLATVDGFAGANIEEFIQQSATGILYDLNRLPEVVLTFIDDIKWVNDYASAMVIVKLKEKIAALENKEANLHLTTAQACKPETTPASTH